MTHEQFEALVARLDTYAKQNPQRYQSKVFLLAIIGYVYIVMIIVGLLGLGYTAMVWANHSEVVALKLEFAILSLLVLISRAMWIKLPVPEGISVTAKEAPALFKLINQLSVQLGAPKIDYILIDAQFNAAIVQIPRLGLLGWYRNYLLIGLPLMSALNCEQFKAVLAHELGHLAGGHARLNNWIYRLRRGWSRLIQALEQQSGWGKVFFLPFFRWYVPYFSAYSFPLARTNEYQADAASAHVASARVAAEALTNVQVIGHYFNIYFWTSVHQHANELPHPTLTPFTDIKSAIAKNLETDVIQAWLNQALDQTTNTTDTHPCLKDRLQALDEVPRCVLPLLHETSDSLLGEPLLASIQQKLNEKWQRTVSAMWELRHKEATEGKKRLVELEHKESPSLLETYERARLIEQFGMGEDAALEQFQELFMRDPDHPVTNFALGQRLLKRHDERGINMIVRAIALDDDAILPGAEMLRNYFLQHNRKADALYWHQRLVEQAQNIAVMQAERGRITLSDTFTPHNLPLEKIEELRTMLKSIPGLRKVYLMRKTLKHYPDPPVFILGFTVTPWWRRHVRQHALDVQERILHIQALPTETLIMNLEGKNARFKKKLWFKQGVRIL